MESIEKRTSPRQALQIPLRFHSREMAVGVPEISSETTNISRTGLFMRSPLRLRIGEPLALTLRVPTYLSGSARSTVECSGRVVHERRLPRATSATASSSNTRSTSSAPLPSHVFPLPRSLRYPFPLTNRTTE